MSWHCGTIRIPPELPEGTALVRMEFSGICGTDKHSYKGEIFQYGGRPLAAAGHSRARECRASSRRLTAMILDQDGKALGVGRPRGDRG